MTGSTRRRIIAKAIAGFVILASQLAAHASAGEALKVDMYVSEPDEINTTSAIIKGTTEMMVVCAQPNISAAKRLVSQLEKSGLTLKYIFLTHAHLDHFQGASVILERFPDARFISAPKVAALQKMRIEVSDDIAEARYGDNAAIPSVEVQAYDKDVLMIDDMPVELWHGYVGDAALGHADEEHTVVYVPSAHTLIPSDIIYYNAHVMMGGSTKQSRKIWMKQIKDWQAQEFAMVIPGHMPRGSDLTPQGALQHTLAYIAAYDEVIEKHDSAEAVIAEMKARFPAIEHESALYMGTYINFRVMHKLLFNPTVETAFSIMPKSFASWIDNKIYESKRAEWNGEQ